LRIGESAFIQKYADPATHDEIESIVAGLSQLQIHFDLGNLCESGLIGSSQLEQFHRSSFSRVLLLTK
jgi:hypothetical protein